MPYGLHSLGYTPKTLVVIREELVAALRAQFGASIDTDDRSILGQLVGIVAEHLALLWETSELVNSSQDPDKASGTALDALCLMTGTFRAPATYSAVPAILFGDTGTVVAAGKRIATTSTSVNFATAEDGTLVVLPAYAFATPYAVGECVSIGADAFVCVLAGTSLDGTEAPTATPGVIMEDGTTAWYYLGEAEATVGVVAYAAETGPVAAAAYDLTTILDAVTGWEGVLNVVDATLGDALMTDSALRLLREQELAAGGSSPVNALRSELLRVPDVVSVSMFVNNTDTVNADGLPPHSVEALVRGPEILPIAFDQSIWDALLAGVAAGILTHGDEVGTAEDDEGTAHTMKFTRPTEIPIYASLSVTKDPVAYPVDGDAQIELAIVAYGQAQATGKDVTASRLIAAAHSVAGVLDVTACFIDDAPAPATSTTIAISLRELAVFSTTRITITSIDGTP